MCEGEEMTEQRNILKNAFYEDALEFWKDTPFFYDFNRNYWLWDKTKFCYQLSDEVNILNQLDNFLHLNGNPYYKAHRQDYIYALQHAGRLKEPKEPDKN